MTDELKPASPLPWRLEHDGPDSHMVLPVVVDAAGATVTDTDNAAELNLDDVEHSIDDMAYIVAACNAYPELRARVAEMEAENARLRIRLEAAERVVEAAVKMKDDVDGKEDWGVMNNALRAYRALDGKGEG